MSNVAHPFMFMLPSIIIGGIIQQSASMSDKTSHSSRTTPWLTPAEHDLWYRNLCEYVPIFALMGLFWFAILLASKQLWPLDDLGVPEKSRNKWHNDIVGSTHALFAIAGGSYAMFACREELLRSETTTYATSHAFVVISGVGFSYFFYDTMFIILSRQFGAGGPVIIVHHLIFVLGYLVSALYPASSHMRSYYLFQLTELSTVFLHLNWFIDKSHVKGLPIFYNGLVLLATFVARVVLTYMAAYHENTSLLRNGMWDFPTPPQLYESFPSLPWHAIVRAYVFMHSVLPIFMAMLNTYWFYLLAKQSMAYVKGDKTANEGVPSRGQKKKLK